MARWPEVFRPEDDEKNNFHYGLAFAEESLNIGYRIRQEKYSDFKRVWDACRKWRAAYEMNFGLKRRQFGKSRIGDKKYHETTIESGERYAYMANRIARIPGAQRSLQTGYFLPPSRDLREAWPFGKLQITYAATTIIGAQEKRLTVLEASFHTDGSPLELRYPYISPIGLMRHTHYRELNDLQLEADRLFKEAIAPGQTPDQRLRVMADLHWISAHAMFDKRGSAAKTEMVVRAIGYAVDIELPPFAPGIVPDLEAFLTPREEFVARYPQMFTRHPLVYPLVEGVAALRL